MDNVHLLSSENPFSNCEGFNKNNRALFFYLKPTDNKNLTAYRTVSSRQVVIGPLDIAESIRLESIVTAASSTTTEMAIGTETENTTLGNILQTPKLRYIYQAVCILSSFYDVRFYIMLYFTQFLSIYWY